jgi:RHS repeat-associated protein
MTNFASADTVISTYAYTLDGVGNRTRVDLNEPMMPSYNAETINYSYTSGNILASADGATYTHDANGNRSQKATSVGTTYYTYDSLNRLTQTSTSTRQIQYIYNGLGQRIGKIDNGVQINYLVDPNGILPQVLAETDAGNNLISFYVYDGAGLVAKVTPQNQYYFYHYDGLGSTIAISDSSGQVANTYVYSPEGLVGAQETINNPFTYVGRFGVMAEGNGLYYMRARYYDPEVGRFINKDPIGYLGGVNLFGYSANNPINFIDPWGLVKATFNAGGHIWLPIDPGITPGAVGVNFSSEWQSSNPYEAEYKGMSKEFEYGSAGDIGVSVGISGLSSACENAPERTWAIGLGKYFGIQIVIKGGQLEAITGGYGRGWSLPVTYTVPLNEYINKTDPVNEFINKNERRR